MMRCIRIQYNYIIIIYYKYKIISACYNFLTLLHNNSFLYNKIEAKKIEKLLKRFSMVTVEQIRKDILSKGLPWKQYCMDFHGNNKCGGMLRNNIIFGY